LYSLKIAIASLSPEALKAALFFIQAFNQSFSLLSVTPARAGPISFLSNLWQEAQRLLYNFLPSF